MDQANLKETDVVRDLVELARRTLETAIWLAAPLLLIATVVSLADQRGAGADLAAGHHHLHGAPAGGGGSGGDAADALDGARLLAIHARRCFPISGPICTSAKATR